MKASEKLVRDTWERVGYTSGGVTSDGPSCVTIRLPDHPTAGTLIYIERGADKAEVFEAAAQFTRERLAKCADIEEEIQFMRDVERAQNPITEPIPRRICGRIVAARQAALAELKKGMKP